MNRITILENKIQKYVWGSKTFIPELMGDISPAEDPQAELWMGSHPKAPSMAILNGDRISLAEWINRDPSGTLGASVAKKFSNQLPFLFKVIAAEKPLSIQAHPNKEQAKAGFERENQKNIAPHASNRNYRDKNHKPELICALEPLWALKGFREIGDIISLIDSLGASAKGLEMDWLRSQANNCDLKRFFISLMTVERDKQKRLFNEIEAGLKDFSLSGPVFDWIRRLNQEYPLDIGMLSPLFLNIVQLQPTEAMYIPSGELHAYLEGAGLEIMANSDNVLRGGLTHKHKDIPELLRVLDFTSGVSDILRPSGKGALEAFYPLTAEEFMLSVISLDEEVENYKSPRARSGEIMICTDGRADITDQGSGDCLRLSTGTSLFIPAQIEEYLLRGEATIYKASVPL